MLGSIFHLTDSLVKKIAKQYVKQIQIDSLPLWKGQATIDNIYLNTDGINQGIAESGGTVRIKNLTASRLSLKVPYYSPGTKPLLVQLHSADLFLQFLSSEEAKKEQEEIKQKHKNVNENKNKTEESKEQETKKNDNANEKDDKNEQKNKSYISKLTSYILICADGVSLRFVFNGLDIELVASNLEIHILPNETKIVAKNVRGSGSNSKTNLKINIAVLIIDIFSGQESKTLVDIKEGTATVADTLEDNPHTFNLINPAINLHMIFQGNNIIVESDTDICLAFDLDSLPSVIDIINAFGSSEKNDKFSPLPNMRIILPSVSLTVNMNSSLSIILKIVELKIENEQINIESISLYMRVIEEIVYLIDDFTVTGSLKQVDKVTLININIDSLKVTVDIQKNFLSILQSIKIPKLPESEKVAKKKYPEFTNKSLKFEDIPVIKISQRVVDFMFNDPIVPIMFEFDECVQRARLQLRVWDQTFGSFIALSTFDVGSTASMSTSQSVLNISELALANEENNRPNNIGANGNFWFRLNPAQVVPGKRWQIIFPEPLTSFPNFINGSTIYFYECPRLNEQKSISVSVNNIIFSLSSSGFPAVGLTLSNVNALIDLCPPIGITKVNASLGLSFILTNFRNSTMSSILDIPCLAFQLSQFPDIPNMLTYSPEQNQKLQDCITGFPMQDSYSSLSSLINIRVPSISLNIAPALICDFVRFIETFSLSDVMAYKVINKSDVTFHLQANGSSEIITLKPSEEIPLSFSPGQIHSVTFPSFHVSVIFNSSGHYRISDSFFIDVEVVAPFAFTATIMSTLVFVNMLRCNLEIEATSKTLKFNNVINIDKPNNSRITETNESLNDNEINKKHTSKDDQNIITTSIGAMDVFKLRVRIPESTDWSNKIKVCSTMSPAIFSCDVLNMLPQCYLTSPTLSLWVKPSLKTISCKNSQEPIYVSLFTFSPLISFKNHLDTHIITSIGTFPPRTSLFMSSIPNNQIIIENDHTIDLRLPLKKTQPLNLLIHDIPAFVDTIPSQNAIIVSPSFVFKNETSLRLFFRFSPEDKIPVEPNQIVPLTVARDPDWLSVGIEDKEGYSWSPPIQIPATRDFSIKASMGNLILFAAITEYSVLVAPKTVAINESKETILMKPSIKIDPDSQSQLLFWRGTSLSASFGYSRTAGFTKPISLTTNKIFKRKFVMNEAGQSLFYITYSVQISVDPNAIVFHHDPSPPFTVVNETLLSFNIYLNHQRSSKLRLTPSKALPSLSSSPIIGPNTAIVPLTAKTVIYLPYVPDVLAFGRIGSTKPLTAALQFPADTFFNDENEPLFVRVEKRGNQTLAIISQAIIPQVERSLKTFVSLFVSDLKLYLFNEFDEPGITKHVLTITASPLSFNAMIESKSETSVSLSLDTIEIDRISDYERFPTIIKNISKQPLLTLNASILNTYGGGVIIQNMLIDLQPFQICIEESFIHLIINLISLATPTLPKASPSVGSNELKDRNKNEKQSKLVPIYVKLLEINETKIVLSFATESFIHADFRNVPIFLSRYYLSESELFDVSLIQGLISHYVSDGLAAIPTLIGSLSLIGSPVNIINKSIKGIKDFYRTAFFQEDTLIHGIGRGSLNIIRGITLGTLESIVGLAYSLEKSIGKLRPNSMTHSNSVEDNNSESDHDSLDQNLSSTHINLENVNNNETFLNSISGAVTGIVAVPIREISSDGLAGLLRITGVGVLGLLTIPTTAFFSLLKDAGSSLLVKVGGNEDEIDDEDTRIDKEQHELPTICIEESNSDTDSYSDS